MKRQIKTPHRWDLSPYEAQQVQKELCSQVVTSDEIGEICYVGGVVIAHSRFSDMLTVAVSVLQYPEMHQVEQRVVEFQTKFPFIPDLLSFREVPGIVEALEDLPFLPDLLVVDGTGIAHPKGLGVASHLGIVADIPTIGCSRSSLAGSFVEPEINAGSQSSLVYQGEIIGTVYRSKNRVAPLFISAGHRISRETSTNLIKQFCQGYRLPEPTRIANNLLTEARQAAKESATTGN
ncbi:MAG TPA: deoxyribonuclease V [Chroococcales cyanobacterium]